VQEKCHSRVQDPLQQRPGSGIDKYRTKVQEDHSDQQSAVDERSEQIAMHITEFRGGLLVRRFLAYLPVQCEKTC